MSATPWFKFFPGDYLADTQRLTQAQHGAYMLILLDYYSAGEPPPDDDSVLARISLSESVSDWKATRLAIARYFDIRDGLWFNTRCEKEISARSKEHHAKSGGGKKGNEIRWGVSDTESVSVSHSESDTESLIDRNTRSQKPESRESITTPLSSASPIPECPQAEIVKLYGEILPMLRQPREWSGSRAQALKARWAHYAKVNGVSPGYATQEGGLAFWRKYFSYVAKCEKLTNGIPRKEPGAEPWKPDLPWLVKAENFLKVIEGNYAS